MSKTPLFVFVACLGPACAADTNLPPAASFLSRPLELRAGPFNFYPRIATAGIYNDNILLSSIAQKQDFIWSVQPAFLTVAGDHLAVAEYRERRLDYFEYREIGSEAQYITPASLVLQNSANWPGRMALLDYGPKFNWFTQYSENNSVDQLLNFNALWPMSALVLGVSQGYRLENIESVEAAQRLQSETIPTAFTSGYRFSDITSAEFNLRRNNIAYPESKSLVGYTKWSNDAWFNYQLANSLSVSPGVDWGLYEVLGGQNQNYERFQLRARYIFAERLSFYASAGYELRQFQNGNPGTQKPVFSLAAYFRPFERTTFYLNGLREESASLNFGYNYSQTGISIGGRRELSERLTLNGSIGYYRLEYLSVGNQASNNQQNDYISGQLSLSIRITTQMESNLFYQYRTVSSSQSRGYDNNQLGLRLNYAF